MQSAIKAIKLIMLFVTISSNADILNCYNSYKDHRNAMRTAFLNGDAIYCIQNNNRFVVDKEKWNIKSNQNSLDFISKKYHTIVNERNCF